jgi:hypothetical protein
MSRPPARARVLGYLGTRSAPRERMNNAWALSRQGLRCLPLGATPLGVADEARKAALAFLDGSAFRWSKGELAQWLSGPYARVTAHVGAGQNARRARGGVSAFQVSAILCDARWRVLAELEAAALCHGRLAFIDRSVARGLVVPARADGGLAWLPVNATARLRDRVLSLFAADALARPLDYVHDLHVCPRCESVAFDSSARRRGHCGNHRQS